MTTTALLQAEDSTHQVAGRARAPKLPRTAVERVFGWTLRLISFSVFAFLVIPILIVIAESFNGVNYLSFPLEGVSVRHYEQFVNDQRWVEATITSAKIAVLAALVATTMGTMAAWALARHKGRGSTIAYGLLYSPVIVPIIVMAMAYYSFFSDFRIIGNWVAVSMIYAVMGIPFVLVAVSSALRHFDPEIENAARTLGAGPVRTLRHITFPTVASGIAAGAIFAFVVAFDEAVIILFVAGSGAITLPRMLWDSVRYDLSPPLAVAGTVLIVVCVTLFLLSELITSFRERKARK